MQDIFEMESIQELQDLFKSGDEQGAAELISIRFGNWGPYRSAYVLSLYYDCFKDQPTLYRCIIDVYVNDGYNFPKRLIMRAKEIAPQIPPSERFNDLPDGDTITVYQATSAPIEQARNGISWTTNKNVAIWFAYRRAYLARQHDVDEESLHVYTGTIKRDKIIAYTNSRNEYEVIQHRNVKVIDELHPTPEEVEAAFAEKMHRHEEIEKPLEKRGVSLMTKAV